jgi:TetR/AcrR family transcriptional regulator, regulator of autoinduction and epiphytic fitness
MICHLRQAKHMGGKESARQAHVLETALTVFARHGFRKTSIEDIAKAAGISRQGIYLHFKNKDEIFSAAIQKALDDGLQAANRIFDDDRLALEEKLFRALDEWFGRCWKRQLFLSKETRKSHPVVFCEEDQGGG